MLGFLLKAVISGLTVAAVAQFAPKFPRLGALILSLPIVSIISIIFIWFQEKNLSVIAKLSYETLILVPLGLIFFVPLALSGRMMGFWPAFISGLILASIVISTWLWLGSK
jgi:hypothetical protein